MNLPYLLVSLIDVACDCAEYLLRSYSRHFLLDLALFIRLQLILQLIYEIVHQSCYFLRVLQQRLLVSGGQPSSVAGGEALL